MTKNHRYLWLILILLLGAVLRIINLDALSLWIDEGFSYYAIQQPDLLLTLQRDVHPPLYFVLLKGWAGVAGVSEFALRYLSVLFGMIGIALVYQLARELQHMRPRPVSSAVPIIAALLMALSEMDAYVAQEVRSYTLHIVLGTLSMWAFLRWSRLGGRNYALIWLIATTALVYTHYLGAWVGVVQGLYALIFLRGQKRVFAVGLLAVAVAIFSIWLFTIVLPYQFAKADSDVTMDASNLDTLGRYFFTWMGEQWALMLGLFLLGLGAITNERWKARPINASALMLLWIAIPVGLTFIGNIWFSILTDYRLSQITVPIVMIWAFGLGYFRPVVRNFLLVVLIAYGVLNVDVYRPKFPWLAMGELTTEFIQADDVMLMDFKGIDFSMEYYLHKLAPEADVYSLRQWQVWEPTSAMVDLPMLLQESESVWVPKWTDSTQIYDLMRDAGQVQTMRRIFPYGDSTLEVLRFDQIDTSAEPVANFDNGISLLKSEFTPDDLLLELWWTADTVPEYDYSVSGIVLDKDGFFMGQLDGFPLDNERPTSGWQAGEIVYDARYLHTLNGLPLPSGDYTALVGMYRFADGGIVRVLTADGDERVIISQFSVP